VTGKTLSIHGVGQGPSKNPLHVYAEVDAALGQGKRQEFGRSCAAQHSMPNPALPPSQSAGDFGKAAALSPHLQDDGFVAGD
jgi:hypothetical protein